jgi:AraC-like DNA-binding protein
MKIHFSEDWLGRAVKADFQAGKLARLSEITPRHLQRIFRQRFACSPQAWLNQLRLAPAPRMLLAGIPVRLVAKNLGFKQASHFCRRFKQLHQRTPSEFVASHRQVSDECR